MQGVTVDKWLVTGATGLLGANAVLHLSPGTTVVGAARTRPKAMNRDAFVETDISDPASRAGLIDRVSPDVVLHAAALSSIEACEADPQLARIVNVEASADLARQAALMGARFVFVSTDAVFDGVSGGYAESDPTSPTTEYGRSKVAAEQAVLAANEHALIARVNFYGWSPSGTRSLAEFFFRHLSAGDTVKGFTDITVSTLYVDDLIDGVASLVGASASGVVHVASSEAISKFEFGRLVATTLGYSPELVHTALSTDVLQHARGSDLSLDTTKFAALAGRRMPDQGTSILGLKRAGAQGVPSVISGFAHTE